MNKGFRLLTLATAGAMAFASFAASGPALAQDGAGRAATDLEVSPMSRVPKARAEQRASGEDSRVIGGTVAATGAWPFQVALLTSGMLDQNPMTNLDAQFCGGSLIAPEWVLTAAHCLIQFGQTANPQDITVLVGATHLTEGERIPAEEIIVHEGYHPSGFDHDIGLIRLSRASTQPAIKLTDTDLENGAAMVTGWGKMENGGFPDTLLQADIELVPNGACNDGIKQIYARDLRLVLGNFGQRMRVTQEGIENATRFIVDAMADPLTPNMLCAGTTSGVRDACNGDSGGPLFTTSGDAPVQVGIVSWGEGPLDSNIACGHKNAYGVYARVSRYKDWIADKSGVK